MKKTTGKKAGHSALRRLKNRRTIKASRGIGASPAAIEPPGDAAETQVEWRRFGPDHHIISQTAPEPGEEGLLWIDISGMRDHDRIAEIAAACGLSALAVADLFHTDQRAHTDFDGDLALTVLRTPLTGPSFATGQVTLVLGPGFVMTLREGPQDCFEGVRKRLASGGRVRLSCAYLFYALIDAIVDAYFPILERYGEIVEGLEERILMKPGEDAMGDIHLLKRELLELRHALWPLREALAALQRDDAPQIGEPVLPYLRDCSDHVDSVA